MAVLGTFEDGDYLPEFGTLTVRDAYSGYGEYVDTGLLEQHATDAQPCGTIARTGTGWLEAASGDLPCLVRPGGRVHLDCRRSQGALNQLESQMLSLTARPR